MKNVHKFETSAKTRARKEKTPRGAAAVERRRAAAEPVRHAHVRTRDGSVRSHDRIVGQHLLRAKGPRLS